MSFTSDVLKLAFDNFVLCFLQLDIRVAPGSHANEESGIKCKFKYMKIT